MPIDLGYFIIKKPRVSPINAIDTKPPSSQGSVATYSAFSISYIGSAYSAIFTLTGSKILTLIDEDPNHIDNLNIEILDRTIQDLFDELDALPSYSCSLITPNTEYFCLFKGVVQQNILGVDYVVKYNRELEYFVDTQDEGKLGSSSISYKLDNFKYSDINSKWMYEEGYIYDGIDVSVPSNGIVNIGSEGIQIKYYASADITKNDINKTVTFTDLELTQSLSSETSQIPFQGAPILVEDTLQLKINQVIQTEDIDYKVGYGILPEIVASNPEPYVVPSSQTFRIRYDSDNMQEFLISEGSYTTSELAQIINPLANDFQVVVFQDDDTKLKYFTVQAFRGTYYHQLRVEDGSLNSILGFTDFIAKKGDGSGSISRLTSVVNEEYTPTERINSFVVAGTTAITDNPFIGVNTDNFVLSENDVLKTKNIDFIVDSSGRVTLSSISNSEKLTSGILIQDNELFPEDYSLYADNVKLTQEIDYVITPEAGWISLTTSAFPGSVYTIDYKHESLGQITGEILLGKKAYLIGNKRGPYTLDNSNNIFIFELNGVEVSIPLPTGTSLSSSVIISAINNSGNSYYAYLDNSYLAISSKSAGGNITLKIKNGTANTVLGFTPNQSISGSGAEGGEQSLEVANTPMLISSFTAPAGGDTIIIKDNDVTSRYPSGSLIKLLNDFYEVSTSYLVTEANIISSISAPYTFLENTNDTLIVTVDSIVYTVKFAEGSKLPIVNVIDQINAVKPNLAEAININGSTKLKLKATSSIVIGKGNANRTLGFTSNSSDTNAPDTYIVTTGKFKNTYVAPELLTTITPVVFETDSTEKVQTPKNSNNLNFIGDQTSKYKINTLVKFNSTYFYLVLGSSFDSSLNQTKVNFLSPLEIAIYADTLTEYTPQAIVVEGELSFRTKFYPNLEQPYALRKNNILLVPEVDYEISNTGNIDLNVGLSHGDDLVINYVARRYVGPETTFKTNYTYFDYFKKGSNIKISFTVLNPDNFYIKVQHATSLMKSYQKELIERNKQIANSSSSGFPTGEIPTIDNSSSGSDSYIYRLGILDEKIQLATNWYDFFDNRLYYFEKERELINGYLVGAEDSRVTSSDISNAVNTPPTRLYPIPDSRSEDQRSEPMRVPALDGVNENDSGDDSLGWLTTTIRSKLEEEKDYIDAEKSKLQTLLTLSILTGSLTSTGDLDIPPSGESMTLYIERKSGSLLLQDIVVANFEENLDIIIPPPVHIPQTASYIAGQINAACSGLGISPASVSGANVVLNANTSTVCIYIVSDAPSVGFGTGNCAAIRSRHILWTGGYSNSYSMTVPGTDSVHLDIIEANSARSANISLHNTQNTSVFGQMEEWVTPFDSSFSNAKIERSNIDVFQGTTSIAIADSSSFDNRKSVAQFPFTAIDDDATINDRISYLNFRRNSEVIPRDNRVVARLNEIQNALTTEALYDPRYLWLSILTNKNNGLYTERKIEVDTETRRQQEAARNTEALNSINNFS